VTGAQTFVFVDLAGFTALTEAHGDEHAADLVATFCREVRELISEHRAEVVKTIGDAVLVRFESADDAVRTGLRIADELGARDRFPGVRIGMHTGDAVEREGDWFGATVNLASRVSSAAAAGEVLMTVATREAAAPALADVEVRSEGAQPFKNVGEPVHLFSVSRPGASLARLPVDPVCRMAVDPASGERLVHDGVEYHFCSEQCRDTFAARPGRYTGRRSSRGELRVSDDARERASAALRQAYSRGRLDSDELEERLERVYRSRTRSALSAALSDLPERRRLRGRGGRRLLRHVFPWRRQRRH
jgi:adenylate cyclase